MAYRFILNETSYHGPGAIAEIPGEIRRRGFKKALIVTDGDLVRFGVVKKITDLLDQNAMPYAVFDRVTANPAIEIVKQGIEAYVQSESDYMIAVGGGSPQDTAKAIGIVVNNPEFSDIVSLEGTAPTRHKSVPVIAVATTAGTAAETTINYVITDEERKRKFVCVDPHDIPVVAVVDPDMMSSMPPSLTAATGMDALTHAIEGYITLGAWELADTLNLKAIELIARSLRKAVADDAEGRKDMALGQYVTGMAFSNVGLGLVHGMAHPLSAFYGTAHGIANAVLLPYVMEFNVEAAGEKYAAIASAMGVDIEGMSPEEAALAAVEAVKQLAEDIGIPKTLREIGVEQEDLEALSEAAMADVCTGGNPRPCTGESVLEVFRNAYDGNG